MVGKQYKNFCCAYKTPRCGLLCFLRRHSESVEDGKKTLADGGISKNKANNKAVPYSCLQHFS